jgi:hypothetical protein
VNGWYAMVGASGGENRELAANGKSQVAWIQKLAHPLTVGAEVWPLQPEPGTRTEITAARSSAVEHRRFAVKGCTPPTTHHPPWQHGPRRGPSDPGLSLGRHAVVTWAMATTEGKTQASHRIASPLDCCGKQGQEASKKNSSCPGCGGRPAAARGEREGGRRGGGS